MRLVDELNLVHDSYVIAVNAAVENDNPVLAEQLAQAYDNEAIRLIAEREGKTHLLPITRPRRVDAAAPARRPPPDRPAPPESQAGHGAGPGDPGVDGRARLRRPFEVVRSPLQPQPGVVPEDPLEVVEQRPVQVAEHGDAVGDRCPGARAGRAR